MERSRQTTDARHQLFNSRPADSRLKSQKSFMRTFTPLDSSASSSRLRLWKDSLTDVPASVKMGLEVAWSLPAGSGEDWLCWRSLNRLRTGVGRAKTVMRRWGYLDDAQSVDCDCGEPHTIRPGRSDRAGKDIRPQVGENCVKDTTEEEESDYVRRPPQWPSTFITRVSDNQPHFASKQFDNRFRLTGIVRRRSLHVTSTSFHRPLFAKRMVGVVKTGVYTVTWERKGGRKTICYHGLSSWLPQHAEMRHGTYSSCFDDRMPSTKAALYSKTSLFLILPLSGVRCCPQLLHASSDIFSTLLCLLSFSSRLPPLLPSSHI